MYNKEKVTFSWTIHLSCNYNCPHCWHYNNWRELEKENLYLPPGKWAEIWDRIYDKYGQVLILTVGGEPTIYPSFLDIIESIAQKHHIYIATNGSYDWNEFVKKIRPENVRIGISFYPYLIKYEEIRDKIKLLVENNFTVHIPYIAYPPQFHDFDEVKYYRDEFKKLGCECFIITSYWGKYKGLTYPDAYTDEEKKYMFEYTDDPETISFTAKIEKTKGRLCWAGTRFASIDQRGNVVACGSSGISLGNIVDGSFSLLEKPVVCPVDYCRCCEYVPVVKMKDGV